jgi:hypothetical protein
MERSDAVAFGGRAFGKYDQALALLQCVAELFVQGLACCLATLNEQRPGGVSEPPHNGPPANLGLGQKMDRCLGTNDHDIQPGDMVADQQAGVLGGLAAAVNA